MTDTAISFSDSPGLPSALKPLGETSGLRFFLTAYAGAFAFILAILL